MYRVRVGTTLGPKGTVRTPMGQTNRPPFLGRPTCLVLVTRPVTPLSLPVPGEVVRLFPPCLGPYVQDHPHEPECSGKETYYPDSFQHTVPSLGRAWGTEAPLPPAYASTNPFLLANLLIHASATSSSI